MIFPADFLRYIVYHLYLLFIIFIAALRWHYYFTFLLDAARCLLIFASLRLRHFWYHTFSLRWIIWFMSLRLRHYCYAFFINIDIIVILIQHISLLAWLFITFIWLIMSFILIFIELSRHFWYFMAADINILIAQRWAYCLYFHLTYCCTFIYLYYYHYYYFIIYFHYIYCHFILFISFSFLHIFHYYFFITVIFYITFISFNISLYFIAFMMLAILYASDYAFRHCHYWLGHYLHITINADIYISLR